MSGDAPLVQVTTQQLDYLVAVDEAPTWARAAAGLGVTPSALSQGLAELERRLGVALFERVGRRRVIRVDAAPVVAYAHRVRAQTQDLSEWAQSVRSGHSGALRVGMIDAAAVGHFPGVLLGLREERPDLELRLTVAPSSELLDQLVRNSLDLAVLVEPAEPLAELMVDHLLDEELAIYAPGAARAAHASGWGPFVTFPPGSHTRELIVRALRDAGADFTVIADSHQPEVLREMVRLGMGWTVLPVIQAEVDPFPLVRARKRPLLTRRLVVARRVDAIAEPAVDHLVDRLREASGR